MLINGVTFTSDEGTKKLERVQHDECIKYREYEE